MKILKKVFLLFSVVFFLFFSFQLGNAQENTAVEKPVSEMSVSEIWTKIVEIQKTIETLKKLLSQQKELSTTEKKQQIIQEETTPSISRIPVNFSFQKTLRYGDYSIQVKYLQIFLNSFPDTQLAQSGAGSPGKETMYFGVRTKRAVIKFQEKYRGEVLSPWGLTKGTGIVGPTTRAKINELLKKSLIGSVSPPPVETQQTRQEQPVQQQEPITRPSPTPSPTPRFIPTLTVDLKISTDASVWYDSLNREAPLNDVDLKAVISGNATGLIDYKFDCENDGVWDIFYREISATTEEFIDGCDYLAPGIYTAKVRVERGGAWAEDTASLNIISPSSALPVCGNNICEDTENCATCSEDCGPCAIDNNPPQAFEQNLNLNEDESISITLSGSDPDGNNLSYSIFSFPQNGILSGNPPNLIYTPKKDYYGKDSFTFIVRDDKASSQPAEVSLTINPVNDPPKILSIEDKSIEEQELLEFSVSAIDVDSDRINYSVENLPPGAVFSDKRFIWRPAKGTAGNYSVVFKAGDGNLEDSIIVNIVVSPLPLKWVLLNGGYPVDGGQDVKFGSSFYRDNLLLDNNANLIYFFNSQSLMGKVMGRFNFKKKQWEIWTFNGWTNSSNAIIRPIGGVNFIDYKMRTFNLPNSSNGFLATVSSYLKNSLYIMDVHSSVYGLLFENNKWKRWNGSSNYEEHLGKGVIYSWSGASSYNYGFDFDGKETGIGVGVYGNWKTSYLMAVKYNNRTKKWLRWKNNDWNEITDFSSFPQDCTPIPNPSPLTSERYRFPEVVYIKNSDDFLVLFEYQSSLVPVIYKGKEKKWGWWNGNSWSYGLPYNYQGIDKGFSGTVYKILLSKDNENTYIFYDKGGKLYYIIYNNSSETFTRPHYLVDTADYLTALDNGKISVFYSNGGDIYLIKETENGWSIPEKIFSPSDNNFHLWASTIVENGVPVIFFVQKEGSNDRLYALSLSNSDYWSYNKTISDFSVPSVSELSPQKLIVEYKKENTVTDNGWTISYRSAPSGHLGIDKEGTIFSPRSTVCNVAIFAEDFSFEHAWGGFWDYFYFPGGAAVDNIGGKVYITTSIIKGGGGMTSSGGAISVWDISKKNESVYFRPTFSQTLQKNYSPYTFGNFIWPSDVAVDEENRFLYVSESGKNRILKYDISQSSPRLIEVIGSYGSGFGQFSFPQGIDVDRDGNLYVVDTGNHRIQKFNKSGNFVKSWGGLGREVGKFVFPYSLSVNKEKNYVFVTDPYNNRVEVFDTQGNFLYQWAGWKKDFSWIFKNKTWLGGIVSYKNYVVVGFGDYLYKLIIVDL